MADLKARHDALGAVWRTRHGVEFVTAYASGAAREYHALSDGAAIVDSSAAGRLVVSGADRIAFLQRMSTNDLHSLAPGSGAPTVLTTAEGRIVDLLGVFARAEDLLVLASPAHRRTVADWFRRNIFFRDKVKLADLGDGTVQLSLLGSRAADLLMQLGIAAAADMPPWGHAALTLAGAPLTLCAVPGWPVVRYELIAPAADAVRVWDALSAAGAQPAGLDALEQLRLEAGIPMGGAELTADYNPLEAGLRDAVSFSKGCYTGQEVIARTENYQKLKQVLVRLSLDRMPDAALPLALGDGGADGRVTSVAAGDDGGVMALGYVRARLAAAGASFALAGGGHARIVDGYREAA